MRNYVPNFIHFTIRLNKKELGSYALSLTSAALSPNDIESPLCVSPHVLYCVPRMCTAFDFNGNETVIDAIEIFKSAVLVSMKIH